MRSSGQVVAAGYMFYTSVFNTRWRIIQSIPMRHRRFCSVIGRCFFRGTRLHLVLLRRQGRRNRGRWIHNGPIIHQDRESLLSGCSSEFNCVSCPQEAGRINNRLHQNSKGLLQDQLDLHMISGREHHDGFNYFLAGLGHTDNGHRYHLGNGSSLPFTPVTD